MKKLALVFLFALMMVTIMACGGNTTTKSATTALPTTIEPTSEEPATIPTTEDYTTDIDFQGELPNGLYKYYDPWGSPLRDIFYDAKAEYALNNLVSGIPIYRDTLAVSYFSERVDSQLNSYDEHLNFNEFESILTSSDEGKTLLNGETGKSNDYTFRVLADTLVYNWNHLDSHNPVELLARYNEAPYKWVMTGDGKELISNYFTADPVMSDVNPEKTLVLEAKEFEFTLKDNLEWQYNPLTDTSSFPLGHEQIDAEDFVYAYKYALRRNFQAAKPLRINKILYAYEYHDSVLEYEDRVGIQVVDDFKFKLTFEDYISLDLVKKMLTDIHLAPINSVMHEELGELYADDIYSIAYSGNYYIEEYITNYVRLVPNPKNLNLNNNFTAIEFKYDFNNYNIINDFNNDLYDMITLDSSLLEEDTGIDDELLKPDISYKTIGINSKFFSQNSGLTETANTSELEPILSSKIFQIALYYAINREDITENIVDYKIPLADYCDPEIDFFGNFHRHGFGYAPGLALTHFHMALEEFSDVYHTGDTITLKLAYETEDLELALYLEENLEDELNDRGLNIRVDIQLVEIDLDYWSEVAKYYPYIQNFYPDQRFINSSKFDYDLYLIDDYIDESLIFMTSVRNDGLEGLNVPEIEISYTLYEHDEFGQVISEQEVDELWSFNAIQKLFRFSIPAIITDGRAMDEVSASLVELTPFGFNILLPHYYSDVFENIEIEMYKINVDFGNYEEIYRRQVLQTDEIIVNGDRAGFYGITLYFELKYYPGIVKELQIFLSLPLLVDEINVNGTTASITLNTDDRERIFLEDSVEVYERNGSSLVGSVEYLGDEIIISGLEEGKEYVVKFLTDDDYVTDAENDFIFKARFLT